MTEEAFYRSLLEGEHSQSKNTIFKHQVSSVAVSIMILLDINASQHGSLINFLGAESKIPINTACDLDYG